MNDDERAKFREFLTSAPIRGAVELRKKLAITEDEYQVLFPTHFSNARDYVLYALCDDLVGVGSALVRWKDLCAPPTNSDVSDALDRATFRGVVAEQRAWTRKLMEALVDLICFESTNDDAYYRHALLLGELTRATHRQEDRVEFFERRLANLDQQILLLEDDLRRTEGTIDLGRAWYRSNSKPLPAKIDAKRLQSSFRARLKKALKTCRPLERMLLGETYALYSQQSGSIHFSLRSSHPNDWSQIPTLFSHAAFLANVLLVRAARLGSFQLSEGDWMLRRLERTFGTDQFDVNIDRVLGGPLSLGDFAEAYGMLVRIAEVHTSQYGYNAFRVRIVDGGGAGSTDEWMTRADMHAFLAPQTITERARALLRKRGVDPSQDILDASVESSVVEMWRALYNRRTPRT